MNTSFHVVAETESHFVEADCHVTYRAFGAQYEPTCFAWDEVIVTSKTTGESEFWGDEMPDGLLNLVTERAEELFYEETD